MTAKFGRSLLFKRLSRYMLILVIVFSLGQFLPGLISGRISQAAAASDPVIAAAGDIACDPATANFNKGNGTSTNCRMLYTSNLLVNANLAAVLALGDNQYYCGSSSAFALSYDLSWGRIKSITHPAIGNHEYLTTGGSAPSTGCDATNQNAAGYFAYYGAAAGTPGQGYYSYDVGAWHLIALNSNCTNLSGGCSPSSAEYKWLQSDLNAHPNQCTLAYWHIPLYSSGGRASPNSQPFWNLLYAHHTDVILNGHDHIYERFDLQNPSAQADPQGIREFIVGTGGADHTTITTIAANSQVINASTYGVLELTLHSDSYDWQFVPEAGKTFTDSGTTACHNGVTPTPTATASLTSTPTSTTTATPVVSNTPTDTFTATATSADTATPTATSAGTATPTATPTAMAVNSNTPTRTATFTNTPVNTNTPTPTRTATNTPALTNTPTPAPTSTNTPAATPTPTFTPTPTATSSGGQSFTFTPVADSYVDSSNPTANFGTSTVIRVDGSPTVNSYIRFNVSGLVGTITQVRLVLHANSSGSLGVKADAVADNTWGETTINFNNAPALGALLASSTSFTSGQSVTLVVTGYVTGDGTFSFGIIDPSTTAISLASRESGANAPQLIVDTR